MRPEACAAAREALPVESTDQTPDEILREGEMEGALRVIGERGYRDASVRMVLEYTGGHRRGFYQRFASLDDCFLQAYETWIDRLGVSLLEAGVSAPDWRAGVRAGLIALFEFVSDQPAIARALFVEAYIAEGDVLKAHNRALERLAQALDSVRSELAPEEVPPKTTASFVVGGIEASLCDVLAAGEVNRIWDALPTLMHMVAGSYLGREAAEEEFEQAQMALRQAREQAEGEVR